MLGLFRSNDSKILVVIVLFLLLKFTIIYTVRAAVLMHNFNDFVTLFGTLELGWFCCVSI